MRKALVGLQRAVLQKFCRQWRGVGIRNDLIVIAMHHQHGHGDFLEIGREISLREGDDAVVMRLGAAHHTLAPPVLDHGLRGFGARPVVAIERTGRKVAIELRAIGSELRLKSVKDFPREAAGIFRGPQHQRRHRADDGRLRHPAVAVPSQIVHHLAAAGGMTDVNGILQTEMRGQSCEVVRIVIHVMAVAGLAGPAVAPAVMGDDAIAVILKEQHLRVPVIGRERPAMREHHWLTRTPILVINLGAVVGLDRWHYGYSCYTPLLADTREPASPQSRSARMCVRNTPNCAQASAAAGRNRRDTPTITMTKSSSTRPWITAKGGSLGGTLGASAC